MQEFKEGFPGGGIPGENAPRGEGSKPAIGKEIESPEKSAEKSPATIMEMRRALENADFDVSKIAFNKEETRGWSETDFNAAMNKRIEVAFRILAKADFFKGIGKSENLKKIIGTKGEPTKREIVRNKAIIDKAKGSLKESLLKDIKAIDDEYLSKELMDIVFGIDAEQSREK